MSSPLFPWEVGFLITAWPGSRPGIFWLFTWQQAVRRYVGSVMLIRSMSGVVLFLIQQAGLALRLRGIRPSQSSENTRAFANGACLNDAGLALLYSDLEIIQ